MSWLMLLLGIIPIFTYDNCRAEDHPKKTESAAKNVVKKRVKKKEPVHNSEHNSSHEKAPKPLTGTKDLTQSTPTLVQDAIQTVIVLDNSRSMNKTDPERIRDQGAKLFLQFLEPSDYFSIINFAEEAKVILPFSQLAKVPPEEISDGLKSITNDGNFTDFLSGIELAQSLFEETTELKSTNKALIILTDGQNDPNPVKRSSETVREEILKNRLPALKKKGIRVYTLALSELADRTFLTQMAKETNGLSWYADNVNEVHRVFSDLFLSLKKPQVLELTDKGFEIDSSSTEATFFVSRKNEGDSILVIDPTGKEFNNLDFPHNWKWFRGPLFDVITVPQPLPGSWMIDGGSPDNNSSNISGFAKLLTNLNLEYDWPEGTLDIGATAILKVRLTGDTTVLNDPQLKNLIFYSYKIINLKSGNVYLQGKLNDNGENGDQSTNDGILSTSITLNEEGDFKMFVSAIGPTFSRQVHIPVSVTRGLISLEHIPPNELTHSPDRYMVRLHGAALNFKNRRLSVISEIINEHGSEYAFKLEHGEENDSLFEIQLSRLKKGDNKLFAVVSGINAEGKEERAKSEEITIHVNEQVDAKTNTSDKHELGHELDNENLLDEHEKSLAAEDQTEHDDTLTEDHKSEASTISPFGGIGSILTLILSILIARFSIKKSKQEKGISVSIRPKYEPDSDLAAKIEKITSSASNNKKRALKTDEMEIFSSLPELRSILIELSSKAEAEKAAEKAAEEQLFTAKPGTVSNPEEAQIESGEVAENAESPESNDTESSDDATEEVEE